jgi:type IV secretion system protein TrbL
MKIILLLFLLFLPELAFCSASTNNLSDSILQVFIDASTSWQNAIKPTAQWLFASFVLIDFVITFGFLAIKGTEFGEIFGELIRKILWIGFFLFLFQTAGLLSVIPESFSQMAQNASGMNIMPDTILEEGLGMGIALLDQLDILNVGLSILIIFTAFICVVAFALMTAQLFMTMVRIQVLIAFSYLIFAFGGLSYTRTTAINPLRAIFSAGMELMIIKLFLALTITTVSTMRDKIEINGEVDMGAYLSIVAVAVILASVVNMINGIVNELMNGLMSGNSTSGLAVAGGAVAGAVVATQQMAKHTVGQGSAIKEARALSANGQGGFAGNYAKALGRDMMDTIQGKNARSTTSAGTRMGESMKSQNTSSSSSNNSASGNNGTVGGKS